MKRKFQQFKYNNENYFKFFEKLLSVLLVVLFVFILNKFYGSRGGVENSSAILLIELPLIIIFFFFNLSFLKNNPISYFIAGLPIFVWYIVFNEFYFFLIELSEFLILLKYLN